jgi:hypothetical protein
LWKRLNELLPALSAAGIGARRKRPGSGRVIALRKRPEANASTAENGTDKAEPADNNDGAGASLKAINESNASEEAAATGSSGNTGNREGSSWKNEPKRFSPRETVQ